MARGRKKGMRGSERRQKAVKGLKKRFEGRKRIIKIGLLKKSGGNIWCKKNNA